MRKLGLIVLMLASALGAAAAEYPDHPIRFIVPQAAGSATDTVARVLAAELTKQLGQQVIVDDRPGGIMFNERAAERGISPPCVARHQSPREGVVSHHAWRLF